MIKVLQILRGGDAFGGVESFIYQYYSHMDHSIYRFDFAFCYGDSMKGRWGDPVLVDSHHSVLDIDGRNMRQIYRCLNNILRHNSYDCVHINTGNLSIQVPCLLAAKKAGVKIRIAHSHSVGNISETSILKKAAIKMMQKLIVSNATKMVSCSKEAAQRLCGKLAKSDRVLIIPNAIDVKEYAFNPSIREEKKEELGLDNQKIYIQVGNFLPVKNHKFSLELFSKILAEENNSVLILAGTGELESELRQTVYTFGIEKNVFFLGYRNDVNELLQVADIMLMPSKWEGFPMAVIEAQASGTTVLCSNTIPKEVDVTGRCSFLPCIIEDWKRECINSRLEKKDFSQVIRDAGYDIETAVDKLVFLYTA